MRGNPVHGIVCVLIVLSVATEVTPGQGTDGGWECAAMTAEWPARNHHAAVALDGSLWILGGNKSENVDYVSDVWRSSNGRTWTCVTPSADWEHRSDHAAVVFAGKMWILGGGIEVHGPGSSNIRQVNDVWCSADGMHWTQVTSDAGWSPRSNHCAVVHAGKMWVLGGSSGGNPLSDVWCSSDGQTWRQVSAEAGWRRRRRFGAVVYNGEIWVLGGQTSYTDRPCENDVWHSANGKDWSRATKAAGWSPRWGHAAASIPLGPGKGLYVLGGVQAWGPKYNDVWHSQDGCKWVRLTSSPGWSARWGHSAISDQGSVWVLGGYDDRIRSDVWRIDPGSN